jgi:protein TonB
LALVMHLAIAFAVLWRGAVLFQPGAGASGPPGGGGGGGRPALVWFALAPPSAPQAHDVPAAPVTVPTIVAADPVKVDVPPPVPEPQPPEPAPTGTGAGTTGAAGQGSGTDGGRGTGTGGGVGSAAGPDSGGDGGYIFPAYPRGVILPPDCVRGAVQLRFWVEVDGHVSRVEVTPVLKDARCRRETFEQLRAYQFKPATRDGRPVASVFQITYTH